MKNIILLFVVCVLYVNATAQTKQQEVGLLFSDFDNFGLTYKLGNEKAMWRFNSLLLNGNKSNTKDDDFSDYKSTLNSSGFNLSLGREYRKSIAERFEMRYGLDLTYRYDNYEKESYYEDNKEETLQYDQRKTYGPGLQLVFGFNYVINNSLVLGAELLPFLSYNTVKESSKEFDGYDSFYESNLTLTQWSYGFSNSSARLSISYRF
ncbi:hypothetical protein [Saccharicrinis aurantiacus]|uniref:hypothetical protein n=1 Tax=Saccharicrinis aurantiacus TaxID=1849719 RepID=UPI0024934042|nr:hypothetical protein [Saccharicrinis aurantiacus]